MANSTKRTQLEKFKTLTKGRRKAEHNDHYLEKWIRARNGDTEKAAAMYNESMKFRDIMKIDKLLTEYKPPEVLQKYLAGGLCGYDKEGSPVRVELFGYLDMKGLMYSATRTDLQKAKLQHCEMAREMCERQTKKLGRPVEGLVVILDMDNAGTNVLWPPGVQMYLYLARILEDNYPEMMKKLFVVNAPSIFPLIYKVCRPLISDHMREKIYVLGGDYQEVLLQYIDPDQLPAYLGGTLAAPDGDPRCPDKICQGGLVPKSYYLREEAEKHHDLRLITVPKGGKINLEYYVAHKGSVLRWEFMSDCCDLGLQVYHKSGELREEMFSIQHVDTHLVPEDGCITCTITGVYVLCFDNRYNRDRSIEVKYNIEVIERDCDSEVHDLKSH